MPGKAPSRPSAPSKGGYPSPVEEILQASLRTAVTPLITASDVYTYVQSPFALWCNYFGPQDARDPEDEFHRLLKERGQDHEKAVVSKRYPHARPLRYKTEEEGFELVLRALAEGTSALHGGPLLLLPEGLRGRFDLLERVDSGPSVFGDFHYVVKEIKLARNIQDHHRLQAAFYNHILGKVQGLVPPRFTVVNGDGQETGFDYHEAEMLHVLSEVRKVLSGERRPPAIHGAGIWPWESYTDKVAEDAGDVSLVGGAGPSVREKLSAVGLTTVPELAKADPSLISSIKGIGQKTALKFITSARAIHTGTHIRTGPVNLPRNAHELFVDLEGTGELTPGGGSEPIDYLIGVLHRSDGKEEYRPFVARTTDGEGAMFESFTAWLSTLKDYQIYHWHHYEPTHLRKLAGRHRMDPGRYQRLFGGMRDLFKEATQAFAFPTYSASIKSIAPYVGFRWRHEGVNAMESVAYYFDYLADPEKNAGKLELVLDYNEDDCRAMRVVKDWLVKNGEAPASPSPGRRAP